MPLLRALYTRITLSWGFVARHREASAAQPAFVLPPPTTVVGAFAYPLLRVLGKNPHEPRDERYGEHRLITPTLKPFLESTKAASAALVGKKYGGELSVGLAVHQELGKLVTAPYRGGGAWERAKKAKPFTREFFETAIPQVLAVQAVGAAYGPGATIDLVWVFDAEKLSRSLGLSVDELDSAASKAVYGVVRLGSKEGIVAVESSSAVYDRKVEVIKAGSRATTTQYVEKTCVEPVTLERVFEVVMPGLMGRLESYYVPALLGSSTMLVPIPEGDIAPSFTLLEPCVGYRLPNGVVSVGR